MFAAVVVFLVLSFTLIFKGCIRPKNFPPGPRWFPIIGSWYDVPAKGIEKKIPLWRKRYGDVIGHKIGTKPFIIVCRRDNIMEILKHPNFQSRVHNLYITKTSFYKILGIFFGDGPQWTEIRHFTSHFLGQIAYSKLEPIAHRELSKFFASIKTDEIIEVNDDFYKYPMNTILGILIDKKLDEFDEVVRVFIEMGSKAFKTGRATGVEWFYPKLGIFCEPNDLIDATQYYHQFFQKRIKEHRDTLVGDNIRDFIDAYLIEQNREQQSTNNDNYYSDEELLACLFELTTAAGIAIGNVIGFILMYVALNPKVQNKIHEELDRIIVDDRLPTLHDKPSLPYCEAVIYETMRINTTAPIPVSHIVTEDTKFKQYTFVKGTTLICGFMDTFLDPQEFEQPESFLPERFLSKEAKMKLFNFSFGKRACVGEQYAKQALFLFVVGFFKKFSISLPKGYENPDTEAYPGLIAFPKPFKLRIAKRNIL